MAEGPNMPNSDKPAPITHALLASEGVQHAFFTRQGGVSSGIYEGLNVGSGSNDAPDNIAENRRRAAGVFGNPHRPVLTPWQVHSPDALTVSAPFEGERPKADAIVTATPGLVIGVVTADCGPILFSDAKAKVVGAAHAGWKGALHGVLENTIVAMETLGASRDNTKAVLGPSISQKNYEVGSDFISAFTDVGADNAKFFAASVNSGHAMFDLSGFILRQLAAMGVEAMATGDCTYADEENFFSYRRTTHRREPDYGRQLSAISIRSE